MNARGRKLPAQAGKPKVLILGDGIVDSLVYDMRAEDAEKSLAWTSPLSWDDWHYAAGFQTYRCVAGATAIHAMLRANGIVVAGNGFDPLRKPSPGGSIFILRKRANPGKTKEDRTRAYLMTDSAKQWRKIAASRSHPKISTDREETWRAAVSLLNKDDVKYVEQFDRKDHQHKTTDLQVVCLWDVQRGSFLGPGTSKTERKAWQAQQASLLTWYKELCTGKRKPPIIIRTSDPGDFEPFLKALADEPNRPDVVVVCALTQLAHGDLRGSGLWSDVWAQLYDYLNQERYNYLFDSSKNDWRFNVVVPVYEDGVIWIGPGRWPIAQADRTKEFLGDDQRPLGSLFAIPGTQPGLSEFEEQSRVVGGPTLLTHAVIEHLAETGSMNLAPAIKQGLMRARRLRSHGYCTPDKLIAVNESEPDYYISYPAEVWKKEQRDATDLLLAVSDRDAGQRAGPYEMECKVDFPESTEAHRRSLASLRIFKTIEKKISSDFVASPENCCYVVGDVQQEKRPELRGDHWIDIGGNPYPLDSFAKDEIDSFRLRQRISMQFGDFAMADPSEAAPILDLAQRVKQHVLSHRYNSPDKGKVFNFALFGSPGSGKSFLAREIARSIDPKGAIFSPDEYNLSQFTEPGQLTEAFEEIASKSVGGKVPLVLWDEFDSVVEEKRGGWLARFLMPMQDAHFFDGRENRPIGTAVFVFIGGTFPTAKEFRAWACRTTDKNGDPSESVLLKARDFHSRLYTALDMPSIVDLEKLGPAADDDSPPRPCQFFRTDWVNSYVKLARAVLLRDFFRKNSKVGKTPFLHSVDPHLCRFLLAIPLRHGARSLQRIVEACLVSKPRHVSMFHLPPPHFLAEHIETENVRREGAKEKGMTIDEMLDACRLAR